MRRLPLLLSAVAAIAIAVAAFVARRPAVTTALSDAHSITTAPPVVASSVTTTAIPFAEARPILAAHADALPPALKGKTDTELEAAWPGWVSQQNAAIRARLERGDEDSLINFWLYGTSFTARPRATERDIATLDSRDKAAELLEGRLDDLVTAIASPGANDRLRFVRQVVERHGVNPATESG